MFILPRGCWGGKKRSTRVRWKSHHTFEWLISLSVILLVMPQFFQWSHWSEGSFERILWKLLPDRFANMEFESVQREPALSHRRNYFEQFDVKNDQSSFFLACPLNAPTCGIQVSILSISQYLEKSDVFGVQKAPPVRLDLVLVVKHKISLYFLKTYTSKNKKKGKKN